MKVNKGKTLREIRYHYGSAGQFAKSVGVSAATVSNVLNGKRDDAAPVAGLVFKRLEDEGLLVFESEQC